MKNYPTTPGLFFRPGQWMTYTKMETLAEKLRALKSVRSRIPSRRFRDINDNWLSITPCILDYSYGDGDFGVELSGYGQLLPEQVELLIKYLQEMLDKIRT